VSDHSPKIVEVQPWIGYSDPGHLAKTEIPVCRAKPPENGEYAVAPYVETLFHKVHAVASKDGKLPAYQSNRGLRNQAYVRLYDGAEEIQGSQVQGASPRWRPDELFYREGSKMVAVRFDPRLRIAAREKLFELGARALSSDEDAGATAAIPTGHYDISPDGCIFAVVTAFEVEDDLPLSIHVIENWYEEFREREVQR